MPVVWGAVTVNWHQSLQRSLARALTRQRHVEDSGVSFAADSDERYSGGVEPWMTCKPSRNVEVPHRPCPPAY